MGRHNRRIKRTTISQPRTIFLGKIKEKEKKDNEIIWEESKSLLIKFQGDSLPTKLLIGYGHVWIKVEPFVESVKQCFKCLRFGHTQTKCRNQTKRCFVCSEEYHGICNETPKCHNCGEEHTSISRECRINQRERFIKKIMAYKNVSYKVAKEKASLGTLFETNLMGDKSLQKQYEDTHRRREENEYGYNHHNTKFPSLDNKNKVDYWESISGPIETDISNLKKNREVYHSHRTYSTRQSEQNKQSSGPRIIRDSWAEVVSKQSLIKSSYPGNNRKNYNDNTRKHFIKAIAEDQSRTSGTSNRFERPHKENEDGICHQGDNDSEYNRKKHDTNNTKTNHARNQYKPKTNSYGNQDFNRYNYVYKDLFESRNTKSDDDLIDQLILLIQERHLGDKIEERMKQKKQHHKLNKNYEMNSSEEHTQEPKTTSLEKTKRKVNREKEIEIIRKKVREEYYKGDTKIELQEEEREMQPSTSSNIQNFYSSFTVDDEDEEASNECPTSKDNKGKNLTLTNFQTVRGIKDMSGSLNQNQILMELQ